MYSIVDAVQRVSLNEMILREGNGFKALEDIDFPLENLSLKRHTSKFEWINRRE
jgi:hypothetical protein